MCTAFLLPAKQLFVSVPGVTNFPGPVFTIKMRQFLSSYYLCLLIYLIIIQPTLLGMLGTNEIIIILVIVLLLFGGKKIPELMRGLGKGVREFNDAKTNVKREIEDSATDVKNSVKE